MEKERQKKLQAKHGGIIDSPGVEAQTLEGLQYSEEN